MHARLGELMAFKFDPAGLKMPHLRVFEHDLRGNISMMFAIVLSVVAGCIGLALDFSRAHTAYAKSQNLLNSAVLAAIQERNVGNGEGVAEIAKARFVAEASRHDLNVTDVTATYDASTKRLRMRSVATLGTSLSSVLGIGELTVQTETEAEVGIGNLRLALVLDNTGSMSKNGKIDALIDASHDLISALKAAAGNSGTIKVAIVPFDTHVNVGIENAGQPWLDMGIYAANTIAYAKGSPDEKSGGTKAKKTRNDNNKPWDGCIVDRDEPFDLTNVAVSSLATQYPADDCTISRITPLTDDWDLLDAQIDTMQAKESTNIPIGLAWGWNMLTPGAPLSAAVAGDKTERVIVLLTDGENTENRWTSDDAQIDAKMETICENIKADGIKIYTIRVIDGNAQLLTDCASDPSMFYDVSQTSQLSAAFEKLAVAMADNHLVK